MPVDDQTFCRTTVAAFRDRWPPNLYVHPEHGDITVDVFGMGVHLHKNVDSELRKTMQFAQKTHPQFDWQFARVVAQVLPFDQQMVADLIQADIHRSAMRKLNAAGLTTEELQAIGVAP